MWLTLLAKGILIGLLSSIPLGPIGVMCVQRTLSKSRRSGLVSGLGAASADTTLAIIALFSLSFVTSFIEHNLIFIKAIGGLCVIFVGMSILVKNPVVQIRNNRSGKGSSLWSDYISIFLVTVANPTYILVFVALFAAFGVSNDGRLMASMIMILGVIIGTSTWWFMLTSIVNMVRKKFRPRHMLYLNRIAGSLIVLLGALSILSMFINNTVNELAK
ncbi:MAG: LysE family transporter [Rikenellaceae bacterium]